MLDCRKIILPIDGILVGTIRCTFLEDLREGYWLRTAQAASLPDEVGDPVENLVHQSLPSRATMLVSRTCVSDPATAFLHMRRIALT